MEPPTYSRNDKSSESTGSSFLGKHSPRKETKTTSSSPKPETLNGRFVTHDDLEALKDRRKKTKGFPSITEFEKIDRQGYDVMTSDVLKCIDGGGNRSQPLRPTKSVSIEENRRKPPPLYSNSGIRMPVEHDKEEGTSLSVYFKPRIHVRQDRDRLPQPSSSELRMPVQKEKLENPSSKISHSSSRTEDTCATTHVDFPSDSAIIKALRLEIELLKETIEDQQQLLRARKDLFDNQDGLSLIHI